MKQMRDILENVTIDFWTQHFKHSPDQINKSHQSDAELLRIPGDPEHCLAVTIDTVSEEITFGIYRDPYTMGWVTIMASLSDLAAVGADPLGMLIAVSLPAGCDRDYVDRIACGMEDACRNQGTFIVGGDTNETPSTSLTGCALGRVSRHSAMSRRGCKPGDGVFMTGTAGIGNALGLVRLAGYPEEYFPEQIYRPVAGLKQGRIIREFATCCMDTSDGVLTTVDQLMRINELGFEIDCDWNRILAPPVLELCRKTGTPEWMMLAGPHGEFELVFTVPQARVRALQEEFATGQFPLIHLGTVQESRDISLVLSPGRKITADMALLRNLSHSAHADLRTYLLAFREIGKQWGAE
jgi:thiamine-monophosphate kinase